MRILRIYFVSFSPFRHSLNYVAEMENKLLILKLLSVLKFIRVQARLLKKIVDAVQTMLRLLPVVVQT